MTLFSSLLTQGGAWSANNCLLCSGSTETPGDRLLSHNRDSEQRAWPVPSELPNGVPEEVIWCQLNACGLPPMLPLDGSHSAVSARYRRGNPRRPQTSTNASARASISESS